MTYSVPDPNAPIGNVGRSPSIKVYGRSAGSRTELLNSNRAPGSGLRYRVLVEAEDDTQQAQVRTIAPEAFPIAVQGKTMMQAGAFGDRDKADQLLQTLVSQGLIASVKTMHESN